MASLEKNGGRAAWDSIFISYSLLYAEVLLPTLDLRHTQAVLLRARIEKSCPGSKKRGEKGNIKDTLCFREGGGEIASLRRWKEFFPLRPKLPLTARPGALFNLMGLEFFFFSESMVELFVLNCRENPPSSRHLILNLGREMEAF